MTLDPDSTSTRNSHTHETFMEYFVPAAAATIKDSLLPPLPAIVLSNTEALGTLELTRVNGSLVPRTDVAPSMSTAVWLAPSVVGSAIRYSHRSAPLGSDRLRCKSRVRAIVEGVNSLHPCESDVSLLQPNFAVKTTYADAHQVRKIPLASYPETFGLRKIQELFERSSSDLVVDLPGLQLQGNATKVTVTPHSIYDGQPKTGSNPQRDEYSGAPEEVFSALIGQLKQASGDLIITPLSPLESVEERLDRVLGLQFPIILKPSVGCQSQRVLEVHKRSHGKFIIKTSSLNSAEHLQYLKQKDNPPQMVSSMSDIALTLKSPFARALACFRTAIGSTRTLPRVNYSTEVKDAQQLKEVIRAFYAPDDEGPYTVDTFIAEERFKIGSVFGARVEWRFISHSERYTPGAPKIWAGFASLPDGILPKAVALLAHGASVGGSLFRLLVAHGGISAAVNILSEYRRLIKTVETFLENLDRYQNDRNRWNQDDTLPDLAIDIAPVWNEKTKTFDYYLIELFPVHDHSILPRVPGLFFVNPWKALTYPPDEGY